MNEEIGGHASVWAIRAQFENCKAYVTPYPSDFNVKNLQRMDMNEGRDLVLPLEHLEVQDGSSARNNNKK